MTLERRRAPKPEVLLERLGEFPWSEWQAQTGEEAHRKLHELLERRRLAIEFFDLVGDDGEMMTLLTKDGAFRYFQSIGGGPVYAEITAPGTPPLEALLVGPKEDSAISFFLRYQPLIFP